METQSLEGELCLLSRPERRPLVKSVEAKAERETRGLEHRTPGLCSHLLPSSGRAQVLSPSSLPVLQGPRRCGEPGVGDLEGSQVACLWIGQVSKEAGRAKVWMGAVFSAIFPILATLPTEKRALISFR